MPLTGDKWLSNNWTGIGCVVVYTDFGDVIPGHFATHDVAQALFGWLLLHNVPSLDVQVDHTVEPTDLADIVDAVEDEGRPGRHVAQHHQHYSSQILEQVFVAHTDSVSFSGLEFGKNSVDFDDNSAIAEGKANFAKPRLQKTCQRSGLVVPNYNLISGQSAYVCVNGR